MRKPRTDRRNVNYLKVTITKLTTGPA